MKQIDMFVTDWCPYCKRARSMLEQLQGVRPEFRDVKINIIDEEARPDISDTYDYYYVPSLFIGRDKLHEGVPTFEKLEAVLNAALD